MWMWHNVMSSCVLRRMAYSVDARTQEFVYEQLKSGKYICRCATLECMYVRNFVLCRLCCVVLRAACGCACIVLAYTPAN